MASRPVRKGTLLVAAIGDASTITGLLLTGMGERNDRGLKNFMIIERNTTDEEIDQTLRGFLSRPDIGIVLISQGAAERVRNVIVEHELTIPTILEIPGDDAPYDPEKDTIVVRAAKILWGGDTGVEKLKSMTAALK
jgi:V-type H+-transporting ATPase subunit F